MEKIVEKCPWRFEDEDAHPWEQGYLCKGMFTRVYGRCTGPDCGPFYAAETIVQQKIDLLQARVEALEFACRYYRISEED